MTEFLTVSCIVYEFVSMRVLKSIDGKLQDRAEIASQGSMERDMLERLEETCHK